MTKIHLPNEAGQIEAYTMRGEPLASERLGADSVRVIYSAAHVVAAPLSSGYSYGVGAVDWDATLAFRLHLAELGLGIAEAMDTAQRGMGLDWAGAYELIRQTKAALPDAMVASGVGTDHLDAGEVYTLDEVASAYMKQLEAVQRLDSRVILMASRALCRAARGVDDYLRVYSEVLASCDEPVILHWLGEMFDSGLEGYWGGVDFKESMGAVLSLIESHESKVDGIKLSVLDKAKEVEMRRRLPEGVRMYTGDDFDYPELIEGDSEGYSDALLGIFDPLAGAAALAVNRLSLGDVGGFRGILAPTVPLSRHIFSRPTQYYKTGVIFLAWLNGFQDHFVMLGGYQSARSLPHFSELFRLADEAGILLRPGLALERMGFLLRLYGFKG